MITLIIIGLIEILAIVVMVLTAIFERKNQTIRRWNTNGRIFYICILVIWGTIFCAFFIFT